MGSHGVVLHTSRRGRATSSVSCCAVSHTKGTRQRALHWWADLCASSIVVLRSRATLHELWKGLRERRRVRQDVEHPAPLERRTDDLLVKFGRDVDAAMSDAVVVRRRRCEAFGASRIAFAGRQPRHSWLHQRLARILRADLRPTFERAGCFTSCRTRRRSGRPSRSSCKVARLRNATMEEAHGPPTSEGRVGVLPLVCETSAAADAARGPASSAGVQHNAVASHAVGIRSGVTSNLGSSSTHQCR